MTMTGAEDDETFWVRAPALFALANEITEELEGLDSVEPVRDRLRELADAMPPTPEPLSEMDPYLRDVMLTAVIDLLRAEEDNDRRSLRIALERCRQALRDMLDERPVWRAGPKHAIVWLRQQGVTTSDLAFLLSTSETTVRRWSNPEDDTEPRGENADRVIAVAKIVNHLRHAMTARGVVQWLTRPHPDLDDRTPMAQLKDPASYRHLVHLASGTRSSVAT